MRADIARLNESTLAAIGLDRATIAAFRHITKQVGMVLDATTLPDVVAGAELTQAAIDALEPTVRALVAEHTDSLRTQLRENQTPQEAPRNDDALRRRVDELEMLLADLRPTPVVQPALPLAQVSCFAAYQSSAQSYPANTGTAFTTVSLQTALFDDLGEFNTGTSTFTAGAAGTYVFSTGVHGTQTSASVRGIALFVNGAERCRLQFSQNGGANVLIGGTSIPLRLAKGDAVTLGYYTTLADTGIVGQAFTYFGGARIK